MIKFEDVWISFGTQSVLRGVNLQAERGQITSLVGPSGSGKSTILKLILGFLKPDRGSILLEGEDTARFSERDWEKARCKMGMVFQNSALFDSLTVCQNVGFYPHYVERKPWHKVRPQVMDILEEVGLSDAADKMPAELSGGMKRRAALARSLIYRPKVLAYDEPTTGLDPQMIEVVGELILEMNEKYDVTSLVVTHDLELVHQVADHVVLVCEGRSVTVGVSQNLLVSQDPTVLSFTRNWRESIETYIGEMHPELVKNQDE